MKNGTDVALRNQTEGALREVNKTLRELADKLSGQWERDYLRIIKDLLTDAEDCHRLLNRVEGSAITNARRKLGNFQ